MSKEEVKAVLSNVLLAFQLSLGLWQFLKLTPLGALAQGVVGWLLRPLGLSPTYNWLQCLRGRVIKTVHYFYVLERPVIPPNRVGCDLDEIEMSYLGVDFHLEKRGTHKNMLLVNGKMRYYITQDIWKELAFTAQVLNFSIAKVPNKVFVTGYKEIWEHVATGKVMTFEEVLDCLILDLKQLRPLEGCSLLLPVDLSVSEEKLLKILNLAGLLLQTRKGVNWVIPLLLSLNSTMMEFCTPLRIRIYRNINLLFCNAMHLICDPLPHSMRKQIYSLGKLVDNLKPSNDISLKVTRGNITAVIAGGAKVHTEGALTLVPWLSLEEGAIQQTFHCGPIQIHCTFDAGRALCFIRATTFDEISMCGSSQFQFLCIITLVSCIAKNSCGSLKSCTAKNSCRLLKSHGPNYHVRVRELSQSMYDYVSSGFPDVYEMKLENVIVN